MEKQEYIEPKMEIILFDMEDIISTSGEEIELPVDKW